MGFEAGDLAGWTTSASGEAEWVIDDGSIDPPGPHGPMEPITGEYNALSVLFGSSYAKLSVPIVVEGEFESAVLRWSDRIRPGEGTINYAVRIYDGSSPIVQLYVPTYLDLAAGDVGRHEFDLTDLLRLYAGDELRLEFFASNYGSWSTVAVDDVSLIVTTTHDCNPPTADAGPDRLVECQGSGDMPVLLDGSGSTDLDSSPGTNDDIEGFEWFEDFGGDSPTALGEGETLPVLFDRSHHGVMLRVTDHAGKTDTDDVSITVADTTPPELSCPADIDLGCRAATDPERTGKATGHDLCGPTEIGFEDGVEAGCGATATVRRTWWAADTTGNVAQCIQTIATRDETPPVVRAPDPAVVECNAPGGVEATAPVVVEWLRGAEARDTCGEVAVAAAPALIPIGPPVAVDVVATDACGNEAHAASNLTVVDTTPPTVTCSLTPAGPGATEGEGENYGVAFEATDLCSTVEVTASIAFAPAAGGDPAVCPAIPVEDGQVIPLSCEASCVSHAVVPTLVVIATDVFGNTTTCKARIDCDSTGHSSAGPGTGAMFGRPKP